MCTISGTSDNILQSRYLQMTVVYHLIALEIKCLRSGCRQSVLRALWWVSDFAFLWFAVPTLTLLSSWFHSSSSYFSSPPSSIPPLPLLLSSFSFSSSYFLFPLFFLLSLFLPLPPLFLLFLLLPSFLPALLPPFLCLFFLLLLCPLSSSSTFFFFFSWIWIVSLLFQFPLYKDSYSM